MKFIDKRNVSVCVAKVGDLIIGEKTKYIVIEDYIEDYNEFHLVDLDKYRVEESFEELEGALDFVTHIDKVLDVIPKDRLTIIAE